MAVHNITSEMVEHKPEFAGHEVQSALAELLKDHILVAHNASFDMAVLRTEKVFTKDHICTLKVAHRYAHSDKRGNELSGRSLQYLRYALDLDEDGVIAHDALGDIVILEKLFRVLWDLVSSEMKTSDELKILEHMQEISKQPMLLRTIRFGKHRGKKFAEIAESDRSYLEWLFGQSDLDESLKFTLKHHLAI
jgi:DNA polymerase III epsilon subunit-like protein